MSSHNEPDRDEIFHDPRFEELVAHLCRRPGMYLKASTLSGVCAFLDGYHAGHGASPLIGLRQWLVVRLGTGNNLHWSALIERLPEFNENSGRSEEEHILALGTVLKEFFDYRTKNGITKIFYDYGKWLLRKSWYEGPLRKRDSSKD